MTLAHAANVLLGLAVLGCLLAAWATPRHGRVAGEAEAMAELVAAVLVTAGGLVALGLLLALGGR